MYEQIHVWHGIWAYRWHAETEISQRQCGKERIYVDKKNNSTSRKGEKVRIIVEHVYGTQDMEETFRPINEQNAVKNIRALMQDKVAQADTKTA